METIRLIGRNSRLSLLQIDIVSEEIRTAFPGISIDIIARSSQGDKLQEIPLHTVEGSDFFTGDFFEALKNDEADIAVHSLKDMSSEHFFGGNQFAVIDRDDIRDVAIFNENIFEKLIAGQQIVVGTCSPRREEMAMVFLRKALPQLNQGISIVTHPIRGNVETRLRKLNGGDYDATILATAGLNRMLKSKTDGPLIRDLLRNKRLMVLPLIECVPAPCQGAVVAEAWPGNQLAKEILQRINKPHLLEACINEKKAASHYGKGCLQKFGVATLDYEGGSTIYAAGRDRDNKDFSRWFTTPQINFSRKKLFSSADHMGSFFDYEFKSDQPRIESPVVYISNYKAIQSNEWLDCVRDRRIWASGTKTWYELAAKGLWVEGSADAFGLNFLEKAWKMPLINISKEEVQVITNEDGAANWNQKGWNSISTYKTVSSLKKDLIEEIRNADIIFWTSFKQYELYKDMLKENVQHICPSGETALLFRSAGVDPVVFPNIKAFQQWKKTSTRLTSGG